MARVRMFGTEFEADPLYERPDGWMMRAKKHTSRTSPGTVFFATHREIVEMAAAEQPAEVDLKVNVGLGELEAAMAKERETLPSFNEIDAKNGNAERRAAREEAYAQEVEAKSRPFWQRWFKGDGK